MLQIPQDEDATKKITLAVLQGRDRKADRHLMSPTRHEIAFPPRAFLPWRLTLLDLLDEPMLPLEELDDGLLYSLRCRKLGEHLGSFIEVRDLSIPIHGDDAVFQAGKNLLPGDFGR